MLRVYAKPANPRSEPGSHLKNGPHARRDDTSDTSYLENNKHAQSANFVRYLSRNKLPFSIQFESEFVGAKMGAILPFFSVTLYSN